MDKEPNSSRRRFLKNATALTVVAGAAGQHVFAESNSKPEAKILTLGVKPESSTAGPVVVETGNNVCLAFYGRKENSLGSETDGTVMITLKDCRHWRLRKPRDEEKPSHSVDTFDLESCEAFEVANSDWKPETKSKSGKKNSTNKDLKHFVFTFHGHDPELIGGGTNFECLASEVEADFFANASFGSVLKKMKARE